MRIACPACNAAYQVPDEQLRDGRVVRCARCGTDWAPQVALPAMEPVPTAPDDSLWEEPPPLPEVVVEPVLPPRMALGDDLPAPGPVPMPPPPPVVAGRRPVPWLGIAWVVSVLAVVGALAGLVSGRERVMQAWPPSIRAYAAVGLGGGR